MSWFEGTERRIGPVLECPAIFGAIIYAGGLVGVDVNYFGGSEGGERGRQRERERRERGERERVSYFSVGVDGLVVVDVD